MGGLATIGRNNFGAVEAGTGNPLTLHHDTGASGGDAEGRGMGAEGALQGGSAALPPERPAVLVIDDEESIGRLVARALERLGCGCEWAPDGLSGTRMLAGRSYHLVVCDIRLPDIDGLAMLGRIRDAHPDTAVVMLSACEDANVAVMALRAGASDYLVKPFHMDEFLISVERALDRRRLEMENRFYQRALEDKVRDRTRELIQKNRDLSNLVLNTIGSLVSTLEAKDSYTEGHSWKVATLAAALGRKMGLDGDKIENLSLAGLLHDIGKIGVRDAILNKPSKLTPEEFDHIRLHPVIGERILSPLSPLRELLPCVRHHHEWYNGSGYPDGLAGEEIPLAARILTIADVYDAVTSNRAYRGARSREEARSIIGDSAGAQFDRELARQFLELETGLDTGP